MITTLRKEEWRPVKGYEGIYDVSSFGRIKSYKYNEPRILKPTKGKDGYLRVTLSKGGKLSTLMVHRIVADTFLKPVEGKHEINHRNEIKTDNCPYNIEWVTRKENTGYGSGARRSGNTRATPVMAVNAEGQTVYEFKSLREAHLNGFNRKTVSECCNGRSKSYKGLSWQYIQKP